jgi:hypothetical protein
MHRAEGSRRSQGRYSRRHLQVLRLTAGRFQEIPGGTPEARQARVRGDGSALGERQAAQFPKVRATPQTLNHDATSNKAPTPSYSQR